MKPWRGLIENGVSVLGSSSHLCFFFLGGGGQLVVRLGVCIWRGVDIELSGKGSRIIWNEGVWGRFVVLVGGRLNARTVLVGF